jgi:hypothetical protein
VTRTRRAICWAVGVGAFLGFCLVTLLTFPPYEKSAMRFAHEPAWWQFEIFAAIGMLLLAAPSYVIFRSHEFFVAHESWRNPVACGFVALELVSLCLLVYLIARSFGTRAGTPRESRPNKSLERTREG